jgi:hypothetical protein
MSSSVILRGVALVRTDVSEELSTSIIRVTRISELGTTLIVTNVRRFHSPFNILGQIANKMGLPKTIPSILKILSTRCPSGGRRETTAQSIIISSAKRDTKIRHKCIQRNWDICGANFQHKHNVIVLLH